MGLIARLKRLWELSGTSPVIPSAEQGYLVHNSVTDDILKPEDILQPKGVRWATVVQDDPLDVFPSDEPEPEKPAE